MGRPQSPRARQRGPPASGDNCLLFLSAPASGDGAPNGDNWRSQRGQLPLSPPAAPTPPQRGQLPLGGPRGAPGGGPQGGQLPFVGTPPQQGLPSGDNCFLQALRRPPKVSCPRGDAKVSCPRGDVTKVSCPRGEVRRPPKSVVPEGTPQSQLSPRGRPPKSVVPRGQGGWSGGQSQLSPGGWSSGGRFSAGGRRFPPTGGFGR